MTTKSHHFQVLVVGGGTAGIWAAAKLKREDSSLKIAIIEPSEVHYYQPAFTLVGAGTYKMKDAMRKEADLIPAGVEWIKDKAIGFDPDNNTVHTEKHGDYTYDYLILAMGLVYDNSLIEGLQEALDLGAVCSNYIDPEFTWKSMQKFKGGKAIFTQPTTPIKCGGAPQKAMYMMADYLRKNNLADKSEISFITPGTTIFGVPEIRKTLNKVIKRYGIKTEFYHAPIKIDGKNKIAYFKIIDPESERNGEIVEVPFDFLHLAPPQKAPEALSSSPLADEGGWADCDPHNLQHKKYKNVFAIGDCSGVPKARTGSAIRKEMPVMIENIQSLLKGGDIVNNDYDGYSACPLVTGYGKMVLGEFDYDNNFYPTKSDMLKLLVFRSDKEHWRLWMLKKYILPFMYWNRMLPGKM